MKPVAPDIVRKGSLIRIAGGSDAPAEALALSYIDLRYRDGHVERWLGPGEIGRFSGQSDGLTALVAWGADVIETQADCLRGELAMDFREVPAALPGDVEVVVEWNVDLRLPAHDPSDGQTGPLTLGHNENTRTED